MRTLTTALTICIILLRFESSAHCDSKNGPVVKAAKIALGTNNVNLVLIWVRPEDEHLIRAAFSKTIEIRKLNASAREMADNYFFETLVRIHRAGEGAPYTGLKDSAELARPIAAVERAIDTRSPDNILSMLHDAIKVEVEERFSQLLTTREFQAGDLKAGREYVANYVAFMHYVESVYNAAEHAGHEEHEAGAEETPVKHSENHGTSNTTEGESLGEVYVLIIICTALIVVVQLTTVRKRTLA